MLCKICHNISLDGSCCNSEVENSLILNLNNINKPQNLILKYEEANTNEVECPKCRSTHIQIKTFQNRSADESVTMRMLCLSCGYTNSGDSIQTL